MATLPLPPEVARCRADETLFWSGAGISHDAPTRGPLGDQLRKRALDHAFDAGTASLIRDCYDELGLPSEKRPRLETILDVVSGIHGNDVLLDILSDLTAAQPNGLHEFFAVHLAAGGKHITANFESCIEDAAAVPVQVLHFHGSLVADPSGGELAATLAKIERGLPLAVRDKLRVLLCSPTVRVIVFVGYSGSDFFDVDPFLRALGGGSLRDKTVLWIGHSDDQRFLAGDDAAAARRQLRWLKDASASVYQLEAPTRKVLAAFAQQWHLPPLADPAATRRPDWRPTVVIDDARRRRASLQLYAVMGLHAEVDRILTDRPPQDAAEWELLAHTRWAQGRYRDAAGAWTSAFAESADWAAVAERRAATRWIRGQFRRATRILVNAIARADATIGRADEVPLERRLLLAESLARAWTHMRRFLDSRPFATETLRKIALEHLPDPRDLERDGRPLGTHLAIRVRSARGALGAESGGSPENDSIVEFGEYEALSAQLHYRHARLRETKNAPPSEYRDLYRDGLAIGATGDAARTVVMVGAEVEFSVKEAWDAIRVLDVTNWHRLRLAVAQLARRARRALHPPRRLTQRLVRSFML